MGFSIPLFFISFSTTPPHSDSPLLIRKSRNIACPALKCHCCEICLNARHVLEGMLTTTRCRVSGTSLSRDGHAKNALNFPWHPRHVPGVSAQHLPHHIDSLLAHQRDRGLQRVLAKEGINRPRQNHDLAAGGSKCVQPGRQTLTALLYHRMHRLGCPVGLGRRSHQSL